MSDDMKEYNDTKSLRMKYPIELTDDQMLEIVSNLPLNPERDEMVSMGLSYDYEYTQKEIILYWMYQEKLARGVSINNTIELKSIKEPDSVKHVAKSQGGLMFIYVKRSLESHGVKNDIDFEKKKEFALKIFNAWRGSTTKSFFKMQLVGYKSLLEINIRVCGEDKINKFMSEIIK